MRLIERIWRGNSPSDRVARAALSPLSLLFRTVVAARTVSYDSGLLRTFASPIPVVSVGNLTVGGTGKTPLAAWLVSRLVDAGMSPALVTRGYGADEPLVHAHLNPSVPVITSPDRVAGIIAARARGANVAVLDDAFQHRRAARDVDMLVVSADDWTGQHRLLPAGPYREPVSALARASAIAITSKAARPDKVAEIEAVVRGIAPGVPIVRVHLALHEIVVAGSENTRLAVTSLSGKKVVAIAGVGNPGAFLHQLEHVGAHVSLRAFADHHPYDRADASSLAAEGADADFIVSTLKDAVKLQPLWPDGGRALWYVSLAVKMEGDCSALDAILERLDRPTE